MAAAGEGKRIVVGVDGSDGSLSALRWAIHQAALVGARVEVVGAVDFPVVVAFGTVAPLKPFNEQADEVEAELLKALAWARPEDHGVTCDVVVDQGDPASVLVDRSAGAELVVVGARGHGQLSGLLLGSTSAKVAHHATCPVVIIREHTLPADLD
jgi:nucleotide-binding universal stress UspA family protein